MQKVFTRKDPQRNSQMKIFYQNNLKQQHIPQTKKEEKVFAKK